MLPYFKIIALLLLVLALGAISLPISRIHPWGLRLPVFMADFFLLRWVVSLHIKQLKVVNESG